MFKASQYMQSPRNLSESERYAWADFCRVLAIFGVVLIHASADSFYKYGKISDIDWLASNFLDSLVRFSVPLFVMLSGALLLKKDQPLLSPSKIAKRITKIFIPLLSWNIFYLIYISHFSGKPINLFSMFKEPPMYHLWFVYMIIGVYCLLPVFQAIFNAILDKQNLQIYLLTLWVFVTCVPIYYPIPLLTIMQQTSLLGYGGYFLLGGIINAHKKRTFPTIFWLAIYLISVAHTFAMTWILTKQKGSPVETAYVYFSLNVFTASASLFIVMTRIKLNRFASEIFNWLSDRSFIIYFVHTPILETVNSIFINNFSDISKFVSIICIAVITFVLSLCVATILRIIPRSRNFLG